MQSEWDVVAPATRPADAGIVVGSPPPASWWADFDQTELVLLCREMDEVLAAVLLAAGVVYALFGRSYGRYLGCLNVAALGVWAGWWVGRQVDATVGGMAVGGAVGAAIAWPWPRPTLAATGGLVGFVVGCGVWRSLGMLDAYAPAGGAVGAVFLFMLAFVRLGFSVTVQTATLGAALGVAGLAGLLLKYPEFDGPVTHYTASQPVVMPVTLFAVAVVAAFYQQSTAKPEGD